VDLIRFFLKHSNRMLFWSVAAGVLSGIANAALLAFIGSTLSKNRLGDPRMAWGFLVLCILLPLTRYLAETLLSRLGEGALYGLRMDLSRKILAAPFAHLDNIGSGRLMAVLTEDIPTVTNAIVGVPLLCVSLAVVVGCLCYIGFLSLPLLGLVCMFLALGIVGYELPLIKAHKVLRAARREGDAMLEHFGALIFGMKELKLHSGRRRAFLEDVMSPTIASYRANNTAAMRIYSAASSGGQALVFVVVGLMMFVIPKAIGTGTPVLTGCIIALLYVMNPLQSIMNALPALARAETALNNVRELGFSLASKGQEDAQAAESPLVRWRQLEFRSVMHTYYREGESSHFTLGPLNLNFKSGQLIFITGGNGSGKTTFAKLLTGLYAPEQGEIRLDGRPIEETLRREWYRQHFSAIFADFYLFEQLLGLSGKNLDKDADYYLGRLLLSHKVKINEGRFSTTALSHGQRKRLALLTAYLEDRPIYLFDEWAADQDPHFKNVFYLELLPELKARNKTVFVISHDDRYYHLADRVIKFDMGKVLSDAPPASAEASVEAPKTFV
jgi:putative ATP-binding cassette transporter